MGGPASGERWRTAAGFALVSIAVLAAWSNGLDGALVFDSDLVIARDPRVHALTWENLRAIFSGPYWVGGGADPTLYRPLATLTYALDYARFANGLAPRGFHETNLAIHVLNALLVAGLLRRVGLGEATAWLGCLVFALHPVTTEAVTNVVGRADALAALFVLAGLRCAIAARDATGARHIGLALLLGVCQLAGLLSKESGIVLVLLVVLYEVWLGSVASLASRAREIGACALALAAWAALRFAAVGDAPLSAVARVDNPLVGEAWFAWPLGACGVLGRYLLLLFWPARLSADYSFDQIPVFRGDLSAPDLFALLSVLVLCGLLWLAWQIRRSEPAVGFLILFFFVAIFPVSNLALRIGTIMGERLLYLPLVGFAGCLAWLVGEGLRDVLRARGFAARTSAGVAGVCALAILASYGVRTHARNLDWRDAVSLFRAGVEASPRSYRTHQQLAAALFDAERHAGRSGLTDEVFEHAERAFEIVSALPPKERPDEVMRNLGAYHLLRAEGLEPGSAAQRAALERAYAVYRAGGPGRGAPLREALAIASLQLGRDEEALEEIAAAARLDPAPARLFTQMKIQAVAGRREEAIVSGFRCVTADPGFEPAWQQLEVLLGVPRTRFSPRELEPLVTRACRMQYRALREAHRSAAAERYRSESRTQKRCRAEAFDAS